MSRTALLRSILTPGVALSLLWLAPATIELATAQTDADGDASDK